MTKNRKATTNQQFIIESYRRIAHDATRNLPRGWREYAAVGASLGLVSSAEAQIVHVVPEEPIRFTLPATLSTEGFDFFETEIDLDGNDANDVQFFAGINRYTTNAFGDPVVVLPRFVGLNGRQAANAAVLRTTETAFGFAPNSSTAFPRVLNPGELVGDTGFFVSTGSAGSFFATLSNPYETFSPAGGVTTTDDILLGFVVNDNGAGDQFGWIRIEIQGDENDRLASAEVVEWAFQSAIGVAIAAGDTGPIPGDFDGDGNVDEADFQEWLTQFGETVTPGTGADGNADGVVNTADYAVWRDNLTPAAPDAVAIPEPTTVSLSALALGAVGVTALRRRRRAS